MPFTGCGTCATCRDGRPASCPARRLEHGGFAEYAVGRARELAVIPEEMSLADGALAEPLAVALHGIELAGAAPGDLAFVIGAGPIGLATAYWAQTRGVEVVVVARGDHEARALSMGATAYLKASDDLEDVMRTRFGRAPQTVFECAGAEGTIQRAIDLVATRGTVLVQGLFEGVDTWRPIVGIAKEVRVQFAAYFTLAEFEAARDCLAESDTGPRAMVQATITLDELPRRLEAMRTGPSAGKVLVAPNRTQFG